MSLSIGIPRPSRGAHGPLALLSVLVVALASPAQAQTKPATQPTVRRPSLGIAADTNSAFAYYMYGRSKLTSNPREAADAYFWAIRLAPTWTQPYYGRAAALTLQDPEAAIRYFESGEESEDVGIATADTLRRTANLIDPFSSGSAFNWQVIDALVDRVTNGRGWLVPGRRTGDPTWDAWMFESQGKLGEASAQYANAIHKYPKAYSLHSARAAVLSQLGQLDSAATEYAAYLDGARKRDTTKLVRFFRPQAFAEYALGEVQLRRGDTAAARGAFERALTEDLSFYMAHVRLGELAAARGDTAAALTEFDTAVQLKDLAEIHVRYGDALLVLGRMAPALKQYEEAIRCEPYYAMPYFTTARIYDAATYTDDALTNYKRFVERASPTLDEVTFARKRITALDSARTAGSSQ